MSQVGYGLSNEMFDSQRINFHSFEGNKNGSAKEHKFRVLPAYAPGKLFHKVGLHWGFKTADGKMKAITCALEEKGSCPICDKVNFLKGQLETIEASLTSEFDPIKRATLEKNKTDIELYISDHRRKPMYLWNVVTEEGDQKVLQLSWNGHDPLFEKIKFIFSQQKIDVTSISNSYLMYCNRSGLKAKTRYQYEMLQGFEKQLDITKLTDLAKVYVSKSLEYLQEVVDTETVPADKVDPNDRNFDAKPAKEEPPQNIQTDIPTTQAASPAVETAAAPVVETAAPIVETAAPVVTSQVELTSEQDKNVAEMMAALNK